MSLTCEEKVIRIAEAMLNGGMVKVDKQGRWESRYVYCALRPSDILQLDLREPVYFIGFTAWREFLFLGISEGGANFGAIDGHYASAKRIHTDRQGRAWISPPFFRMLVTEWENAIEYHSR